MAVRFKPTPHMMFPDESVGLMQGNWVVFRLQPEEGVLSTFIAKRPGPEICLTSVTSKFLYAEEFATFGADDVYDQADAGGFIRLLSLSSRIAAQKEAT